jgi:hypothetical protein
MRERREHGGNYLTGVLTLLISFDRSLLPALQEGCKSVTRRRIANSSGVQESPGRYAFAGMEEGTALFHETGAGDGATIQIHCPFGMAGQLLRVQEAPSLLLRVVGVRAERVRGMTEADALAEGLVEYLPEEAQPAAGRWFGLWGMPATSRPHASGIEAFRSLLTTFYPMAWELNEWMWVVDFERVLPAAC